MKFVLFSNTCAQVESRRASLQARPDFPNKGDFAVDKSLAGT
jgi:hypothetical protein